MSNDVIDVSTPIISPPGIAMPPAALCLTDVTSYFKCRPFHSTTGGWIVMRIVALTLSMKEYYGYKFDPVTPEIVWLICMGGDCT